MSEYDDNLHEAYLPEPEPHVFTTDGYVHAHMLGSVACATCGRKYADARHIIKDGPTDRAMRGES